MIFKAKPHSLNMSMNIRHQAYIVSTVTVIRKHKKSVNIKAPSLKR